MRKPVTSPSDRSSGRARRNRAKRRPWLAQRILYAALCDSTLALPGFNSLPPHIDSFLIAFVDTATDTLMAGVAADLLSEIEAGDTIVTPTDSGLTIDTPVATFFAARQTSDYNAIQACINAALSLKDTSSGLSGLTLSYSARLAAARALVGAVPDTTAQDVNFKTFMNIYLSYSNPTDTAMMDTASLNTLDSLALLCPYTGGDAVYYARALYAQYVDTLFFDDIQLCPIDSTDTTSGGSYRMLMLSNTAADTATPPLQDSVLREFAKVYPNPAKDLLNLAFAVHSSSSVEFDLTDELGETVMREALSSSQTFAQFSTSAINSGLYYWTLKDRERVIKAGKVAVIK